MPKTAEFCAVLFGIGIVALVLIVAASPWLCRLRIDEKALSEALSASESGDRRASNQEAA